MVFTGEQLAYYVGDTSQAQYDNVGVEWWLREPQPPLYNQCVKFIPLPEVLESKRVGFGLKA